MLLSTGQSPIPARGVRVHGRGFARPRLPIGDPDAGGTTWDGCFIGLTGAGVIFRLAGTRGIFGLAGAGCIGPG